jgi:hypothetical protein
MSNRAKILKQKFNQSLGLPLEKLMPSSRLDEILEEEHVRYRNRVYTPIVTIWAMVSQVPAPDKSLKNGVKQIISWLAAAGVQSPSNDTGAYSIGSSFNKLPVINSHLIFGNVSANARILLSPC